MMGTLSNALISSENFCYSFENCWKLVNYFRPSHWKHYLVTIVEVHNLNCSLIWFVVFLLDFSNGKNSLHIFNEDSIRR